MKRKNGCGFGDVVVADDAKMRNNQIDIVVVFFCLIIRNVYVNLVKTNA